MLPPITRYREICDYQKTWDAMQAFVKNATHNTTEEIWLLQHPPVYTMGRAGKTEHLLEKNDIPLIKSDRGGQITYHGPGQLIAYLMLNITKRHYGLRELVRRLEFAIIQLLSVYAIAGRYNIKAPGVYVNNEKIAALGLRVCRGWTYHGLSLNVNMDLSPFANINPCGYAGLNVTQMKSQSDIHDINKIAPLLAHHLQQALSLPALPAQFKQYSDNRSL